MGRDKLKERICAFCAYRIFIISSEASSGFFCLVYFDSLVCFSYLSSIFCWIGGWSEIEAKNCNALNQNILPEGLNEFIFARDERRKCSQCESFGIRTFVLNLNTSYKNPHTNTLNLIEVNAESLCIIAFAVYIHKDINQKSHKIYKHMSAISCAYTIHPQTLILLFICKCQSVWGNFEM